jgi:hypothetical protein
MTQQIEQPVTQGFHGVSVKIEAKDRLVSLGIPARQLVRAEVRLESEGTE